MAVFPLVLRARGGAWPERLSTLSLATCHAGFSRRGIDPVGETSNVPDIPLGSRHLVVSTPASANRRDPWSSQTNSPRRQPSPSRQPSPGSRVRGRFRPRPRFGGGAQCYQPGRGRNRCSFRHAYGLCPRRPRRQPGPPVRCQHRRSSGDRRVVEEVPGENDRFGIHRRLLDSSVRAS